MYVWLPTEYLRDYILKQTSYGQDEFLQETIFLEKLYRLIEGIAFQKHFSFLLFRFYFIAIVAIIPVSLSLFWKEFQHQWFIKYTHKKSKLKYLFI